MTAPAASGDRPGLRLGPQDLALVGVAALAWGGVIAATRHIGNGAGTMGMGFAVFVAMWSLMMAAMMLPAVAPVASLYVRAIGRNRIRGLLLFAGGYLLVWSAAGVAVYAGLRVVDERAVGATMRIAAAVVLVVGGLYQLTPLKAVCLRHCRSPLGQLLRYGNVSEPLRDLRIAVHHAGYCLGCCWALMALFIAFGVMNLWAMLGLAAVVVSEKQLRHGGTIGRLAGAAFIILGLLVAASPRVADAVVPSQSPTASTGTDM